ncbi:MAG: hypothetical protein VX000_18305 [Myxococcota bacterium]|nr:hypothetical protein [Myxococcota bacterium]
MGIGRKLVKGMARKMGNSMLDKVGRRLVHTLGDTSSDAPDAAFEPKRNLYDQMRRGEVDESGRTRTGPESDGGHDGHDHGHSHGHNHDH